MKFLRSLLGAVVLLGAYCGANSQRMKLHTNTLFPLVVSPLNGQSSSLTFGTECFAELP